MQASGPVLGDPPVSRAQPLAQGAAVKRQASQPEQRVIARLSHHPPASVINLLHEVALEYDGERSLPSCTHLCCISS